MEISKIIFFIIRTLREKNYIYDRETYIHSYRVMRKTNVIINNVYKDNIENIDILSILVGTFLHDAGKILVPKEILYKPDKLSKEEFDIIKFHPENGVKIIEKTDLLDLIEKEFNISLDKFLIENIILYHHEKLNGDGYYGVINDDSIINIVAVSDVFCALTEPRSYKKMWSKEYAISIIKKMEFLHPTAETVITTL